MTRVTFGKMTRSDQSLNGRQAVYLDGYLAGFITKHVTDAPLSAFAPSFITGYTVTLEVHDFDGRSRIITRQFDCATDGVFAVPMRGAARVAGNSARKFAKRALCADVYRHQVARAAATLEGE